MLKKKKMQYLFTTKTAKSSNKIPEMLMNKWFFKLHNNKPKNLDNIEIKINKLSVNDNIVHIVVILRSKYYN